MLLLFLQHYIDYYEAEEEINSQLNVFAVNMKTAYGGLNDVHTQIGYPSKNGIRKKLLLILEIKTIENVNLHLIEERLFLFFIFLDN